MRLCDMAAGRFTDQTIETFTSGEQWNVNIKFFLEK